MRLQKNATEAALTGHLVFSTLHTNHAIQAVVRLVELGIEPYLVAPSISAVMAQRLAARICDHCKQAYTPERDVLDLYFYDGDSVEIPFLYHGVGCAYCRQTGYHGRMAFHGLALVTEEMRALISRSATDDELTCAARRAEYQPLRYDALKKALLGFTTLEEVESHTTNGWAFDSDDAN